MSAFECVCLAIVGLYLAIERPRGPRARRLLLIAVAAWLSEDTCMRLYDFYAYDPAWSGFIDRMPVLVALIWAPVVMSAWGLARRLGRGALAGAAFVFADAWLVEPIAVASGLWRWHEPGLFGVPPIGVLGWALFAGACMAAFEWLDRRGAPAAMDLLVVPFAALATHAMLLAAWWGALRWVDGTVPAWPAAALAVVVSVVLTARAPRGRVPLAQMAPRIPGAVLFFVLLARHGSPALVLWSLAFAPPYLALTSWRAVETWRSSRSSRAA
jgi:hypothetical protein